MTEPTVFAMMAGVALVAAVTLGVLIGRWSRDGLIEALTIQVHRSERAGIKTAQMLMKERAEHSDKILFFKARIAELSLEKVELLKRCGEYTPLETET